jgi:hypothetical protein
LTDRSITAPTDGTRVLKWYEGVFETAFCIVNPFLVVSEGAARSFECDAGPTNEEVRNHARALTWAEVTKTLQIEGLQDLATALRAISGQFGPEGLQNPVVQIVDEYVSEGNVVPPEKGYFSPIQVSGFLEMFRRRGYREILIVDEFGFEIEIVSVRSKLDAEYPVLGAGHPQVLSDDRTIMLATHWDSYTTLFCGRRKLVEEEVERQALEGFFCDENTSLPVW